MPLWAWIAGAFTLGTWFGTLYMGRFFARLAESRPLNDEQDPRFVGGTDQRGRRGPSVN